MKKHYLLAICLVGMLLLSGCGEVFTQAEADAAIAKARAAGVIEGANSKDITSNDAEVIANAEPELTKMVAELQAEITNITLELGIERAKPKADGTTTSTDSDTVVTTGGYNIDNIKLNVGIEKILDDGELTKLTDDKITFDGKDYDFAEYLEFTSGAKIVGSNTYEDFEDNPYLTFEKGSIIYSYKVEDAITDLNDDEETPITKSEPLEINF